MIIHQIQNPGQILGNLELILMMHHFFGLIGKTPENQEMLHSKQMQTW
jgi:hypothetical protein